MKKGTRVQNDSYEAAKDIWDIGNATAEQLFEQQLALVSTGAEFVSRQITAANKAKSYRETLDSQAEIVNDVFGKTQGILRNTVDIVTEAGDEVYAWVGKGIQQTAEKVS